jgi:hypothetical protein
VHYHPVVEVLEREGEVADHPAGDDLRVFGVCCNRVKEVATPEMRFKERIIMG